MALYGPKVDGREVKIYENLNELSTGLAEYIAELSEDSVKEKGTFAIALSGGSLISLMGKLCELPFIKTVEWGKWHIFWAEERAVSKSHVDSNYKLTKDAFLSKVPVGPGQVHSINDAVSAEKASEEYEFVIRQLVKTRVISASDFSDSPRFDLILLGMGPDGHVASLFPGHPTLAEKEDWVSFLTDSPEPPPERITFTLPVINSASNVAMVVVGSTKAEAVHLVVDEVRQWPDSPFLPARMVQPCQGKLVWFLDRAAASKLEEFSQSQY